MGAIVAAFSKKGRNEVPKVLRMLAELEHRGRDMHGVATADVLKMSRSVQELASLGIGSDVAVGHNLSRILRRDVPQPVQDGNVKFVFEGRFFPPTAEIEVYEIMKDNGKSVEKKTTEIIKGMDGSYAFAYLSNRRIVLGRDPLGLTPLYFGEGQETYAFASERKALWAIGIHDVKSFPPGNMAVVDDERVVFQPIRTVSRPKTKRISMEDAVESLESLLTESISERILDTRSVGVAFSGGLDSGILASFAKGCDSEIQLIHVGMEGNGIQHVEGLAGILDLPLRTRTFTPEDVKKVLSRILWLVEEPDVLKVSVAIPFYLIAEAAHDSGLNVLLAGQGCDELFGGYQRYLREYATCGSDGVEEALYRDVTSSYEVNFERDDKVCAFHGVELRLPFADYDLVAFSLGLPINLKIASTNDHLRKRVLRKVAKRKGLPPTVYNKRKRAIQYSTMVHKALRNMAREEGLSLKDFIERSFQRSYNQERTLRNG